MSVRLLEHPFLDRFPWFHVLAFWIAALTNSCFDKCLQVVSSVERMDSERGTLSGPAVEREESPGPCSTDLEKMSAPALLLLSGCLQGTAGAWQQGNAQGPGKSRLKCYLTVLHLHSTGFSVPIVPGRTISPLTEAKPHCRSHTARIWIRLVQLQTQHISHHWILFREKLLGVVDEAPIRAAERLSPRNLASWELMLCKCEAASSEKVAAPKYLSRVLSVLQHIAYGTEQAHGFFLY